MAGREELEKNEVELLDCGSVVGRAGRHVKLEMRAVVMVEEEEATAAFEGWKRKERRERNHRHGSKLRKRSDFYQVG